MIESFDLAQHIVQTGLAANVLLCVSSEEHVSSDPRIQISVMNVCKMDRLPDETFDLVFFVSLDSIFASFGTYQDVLRASAEICRVMKTGGRTFAPSHASPPARMPHLQHPTLSWKVEHQTLCQQRGHVYVCTKIKDETSRETASANHRRHSCVHFKDKWTPGQLTLTQIRDRDVVHQVLNA